MSQREVLAVLNDPVAQELLRSASLARLAYIGTDGTPRVIPIGFHWNGREIVVCTAPTAPKVRALQANEHVALTIDTEQHLPQQLLVRGSVRLDVVDGVPPEYLRATEKVLPEDQWDEFTAQVRSMYKQMVRITIVPAWARVFDFATGRVPAFLQRLAEERSAAGDGNE